MRTHAEYRRRRLEDSTNIPPGTPAFETALEHLDKTQPYVIYCRTGGRSERAMEVMKKKGFVEVYNMAGGITAWRSEGYHTISLLQTFLKRLRR